MRRTALVVTATTVLALAGCGGGDGDDRASSATTSSPSAEPAMVTATAAAQHEDVNGKANCLGARVAYAPIAAALDGSVDVEEAVQFFNAADFNAATSQAGQDAAAAIAAANDELALARTNVLTGQPVDAAKLRSLLEAVEDACEAVLAG